MTLYLINIITVCALLSTCNGFSVETRLEKLEDAMHEKDIKIALLENLLLQKDERMDFLENALLQKDEKFDLLEKAMLHRDIDVRHQMTLMQESLSVLESRLTECPVDNAQKQSEMNEEEKSISHLEPNLDINSSNETEESDSITKDNSYVSVLNRQFSKIKRQSETTNIAFHAYVRSSRTYNTHETIVFDAEEIDIGHAYNSADGIYDVPVSGVYVFSWTIVSVGHTYHTGELIVNGVLKGLAIADSGQISEKIQGTGLVVIHVNKGDHVLVRIGSNSGGSLVSGSSFGRVTFSGWLLFNA